MPLGWRVSIPYYDIQNYDIQIEKRSASAKRNEASTLQSTGKRLPRETEAGVGGKFSGRGDSNVSSKLPP